MSAGHRLVLPVGLRTQDECDLGAGPSRERSASSGAGLDTKVGKCQRRDMAKNVKILFPHLLCLNTYLYHLSCNQAEQDLDPGIPFTAK